MAISCDVCSRRQFMRSAGLLTGGLIALPGCVRISRSAGIAGTANEHEPTELTPDVALQQLLQGNERYVAMRLAQPHRTAERRREVAKGQHPFAVIFGCADSRVPPEIVFDQGLGDLFVIREIGHVPQDEAIGSIEYAVGHMHVPLVIVLGHEKCGAVQAAVDAVLKGAEPEGHIRPVIADIKPAVAKVKDQAGDVVDLAVRANVELTVTKLKAAKPVLAEAIEKSHVRIVGARYDLQTGKVDVLV